MGYRKFLHRYQSKGARVSPRVKNAAQKLQQRTKQSLAAIPSQNSMDVEDWLDFGEWARVRSSNLGAIQYWMENKSLFITFKNGSTYVYSPVPRALARDLFLAGSKGKFHWRRIRNSIPYGKLS